MLRSGIIAEKIPTTLFVGLWNWFVRGIAENVKLEAVGSPELYKQSLLAHSGGSTEAQNADRMGTKDCDGEI